MLEAYLKGMEQAKFDSSSVVYVASGMLSYNASEGEELQALLPFQPAFDASKGACQQVVRLRQLIAV